MDLESLIPIILLAASELLPFVPIPGNGLIQIISKMLVAASKAASAKVHGPTGGELVPLHVQSDSSAPRAHVTETAGSDGAVELKIVVYPAPSKLTTPA